MTPVARLSYAKFSGLKMYCLTKLEAGVILSTKGRSQGSKLASG